MTKRISADHSALTSDAVQAIVQGVHSDPFSVLGPHPVGKGWQVRAFVPGAQTLEVMIGGVAQAAIAAPGVPGFFTADLKDRVAYRLRANGDGAVWEFDDPFRFGPVLGEMDEYLLGEGTHKRLWQVLGAHVITHEGAQGVHFAVWAPNAQRVSVVGDFNIWDGRRAPMRRRGPTGVWEIFIPGLGDGDSYKFEIRGAGGALLPLKADPVGFGSEHPPANASVVRDLRGAKWDDGGWMAGRGARQKIDAPISVYEVHLASWRRAPGDRMLSYTELADQLVSYVADMGFTHIELMPISEHPFDGSWGYQPVGLYAPTIRHGTPAEFRAMIDAAHRAGLGVLLDWVPGH
ncbi:MAG: alpha-amylase family glycosyl hydrolase, partial [Paracoccaceae bacterium]|nr:alpha-amylase family glycosyl hydrolase [Paracoccaceae bacterium]